MVMNHFTLALKSKSNILVLFEETEWVDPSPTYRTRTQSSVIMRNEAILQKFMELSHDGRFHLRIDLSSQTTP